MSVNMKEGTVRSVWLEGVEASKSIPDQFGKKIDQITGQLKGIELTKIDSAFKQYQAKAKDGLTGFLSKFDLGVKLPLDEIEKYAKMGKQVVDYAQEGLAVYQEFKSGQYEALLNRLTGLSPEGGLELAKFGLESYRAIQGTDWKDWQSVMGLASKITGVDIPDLLGITQLQAQVSSLLDLAQQYNVPEAIAMIRDKLGKPDLSSSLYQGIGINAKLGQFEMIEQMMYFMGGEAVLATNPDIIEDILANYRLPLNHDSSKLGDYKDRLVAVLRKIDSNWDREVIGTATYMKLSPWAKASEHAKLLFLKDTERNTVIHIADQYPPIKLREGLNQTYPYLKLR